MSIHKKSSISIYHAYLTWLLAALFYMYEFLHRVSPNVISVELMHDFNLSAGTLGQLAACYFYAYALVQIPAGILFDQLGVRRLLTFSAGVVAVGSIIFSMTTSFYLAAISRFCIGLGSGFSFVACLKIGSVWFPKERFGTIVGLTNLLGVMGAIFAGYPLAMIVDGYGWRSTFYGLGLIGLLICILIYTFVLRDAPRCLSEVVLCGKGNDSLSTKKTIRELKNSIKNVVTIPSVWLTSLVGCCMLTPVSVFAELWGASFLVAKLNILKPLAASITSVTFFGIAVGGPSFGFLSDHFRQKKAIMAVGCLGGALSMSTILAISSQNILVYRALFFAFGFFTSSMLLCFKMNNEIVPEQSRGTAIGFTNTIIMLASVVGQPLAGILLETNGAFSSNQNLTLYLPGLVKALSFLPLCYIIALIFIFFTKDQTNAANLTKVAVK